MLVIFTNEQLLPPQQVCGTCLLADTDGHPRWQQGMLRCGRPLLQRQEQIPTRYQCAMGFQVAQVEEPLPGIL
jgi:hypothetical protein